jgi:hypothetical protein
MKEPTNIAGIIPGIVYTVPSYTNIDGEKVNGKNATIKFYDETTDGANSGVDPISIILATIDHLSSKQKATAGEDMALAFLDDAYTVLVDEKYEE